MKQAAPLFLAILLLSGCASGPGELRLGKTLGGAGAELLRLVLQAAAGL